MTFAVIFNGQGAQYPKMGLDFKVTYTQADQVFKEASEAFGDDISELVSDRFDALRQTCFAQPAISTVSLAIFKSIEHLLPKIDYMAGLSLGEYSALMASGALSVSEGIQLLAGRGRIMSDVCQVIQQEASPQMAAVIGMPLEVIETLIADIDDLYIANLNARTQTILAGTRAGIKAFNVRAKEAGYRKGLPLKVEGPFHSPLMKEACAPYRELLERYSLKNPIIPVISNTTLCPHTVDTMNATLVDHMVEPVQWYQTIDAFVEQGVTHMIQVGPGDILAKLLKKEPNAPACLVIDQVEDVALIGEFLQQESRQ